MIFSEMDRNEENCLKFVGTPKEMKEVIAALREDYCPICGRLMTELTYLSELGETMVGAWQCPAGCVEILAED